MSIYNELTANLEQAAKESNDAGRAAAEIMNAVADGLKRAWGVPDVNIGFLPRDKDRADTGERTLLPDAELGIDRDDEGVWNATMSIRMQAPKGRLSCDTYIFLGVQPSDGGYLLSLGGEDQTFQFDDSAEKVISQIIQRITAVCSERVEETIEWIRTGRSTERRGIGFHVIREPKV